MEKIIQQKYSSENRYDIAYQSQEQPEQEVHRKLHVNLRAQPEKI